MPPITVGRGARDTYAPSPGQMAVRSGSDNDVGTGFGAMADIPSESLQVRTFLFDCEQTCCSCNARTFAKAALYYAVIPLSRSHSASCVLKAFGRTQMQLLVLCNVYCRTCYQRSLVSWATHPLAVCWARRGALRGLVAGLALCVLSHADTTEGTYAIIEALNTLRRRRQGERQH